MTMPLVAYKKKRQSTSPEPKGKKRSGAGKLQFVVQKHYASHLHYDFRLELDGVLKSWAVPKGPPADGEKRLAIMVEDHPYDYKDFSGTIPKGHYGAGVVEIWDSGTYTTVDADSREEIEKSMHRGFKKGHLHLVLHGRRLKGEYSLIRTPRPGSENAWLLVKKVLNDDNSPRRAEPMPTMIEPMLATLGDKAFNKKDWLFEIKWDGYRCIAYIKNGKVKLLSRNQKSFNRLFKPIAEQLKALHETVILDGEIVVLDEKGRSNFQALQNYDSSKEESLFFQVFDLLYQDGHDLRERPLIERKERLEIVLRPLKKTSIHYCDHVETNGVRFFNEAKKLGLEGIIAKNGQSNYQMKRSRDWIKIKASLRKEVVIGGFTAPRGGRKEFGALLVGVFDGKKLRFIGHVGTGFSDETLSLVMKKLRPLVVERSPFVEHPPANAPVTYVKPVLVSEVSFSEMTKEGVMRHPVFLGLHVDKKASDVEKG